MKGKTFEHRLHDWFCQHARYLKVGTGVYVIRVGSKFLRDSDTANLLQKVKAHLDQFPNLKEEIS